MQMEWEAHDACDAVWSAMLQAVWAGSNSIVVSFAKLCWMEWKCVELIKYKEVNVISKLNIEL